MRQYRICRHTMGQFDILYCAEDGTGMGLAEFSLPTARVARKRLKQQLAEDMAGGIASREWTREEWERTVRERAAAARP